MILVLPTGARKPVAKDRQQQQFTTFANRLREKRTALGLSQAALGELAGLHQVSVARLESGAVDVPLSTLQKLAEALGCQPADLIAPEEPPTRATGKRK